MVTDEDEANVLGLLAGMRADVLASGGASDGNGDSKSVRVEGAGARVMNSDANMGGTVEENCQDTVGGNSVYQEAAILDGTLASNASRLEGGDGSDSGSENNMNRSKEARI